MAVRACVPCGLVDQSSEFLAVCRAVVSDWEAKKVSKCHNAVLDITVKSNIVRVAFLIGQALFHCWSVLCKAGLRALSTHTACAHLVTQAHPGDLIFALHQILPVYGQSTNRSMDKACLLATSYGRSQAGVAHIGVIGCAIYY